MSYVQVRQYRDTYYTGGWCLAAVGRCFALTDTTHFVADAGLAWEQEVKSGAARTTRPPSGVAVPIFFSFADHSISHIAVSLPDGRVASSSLTGYHTNMYIHKSITDMMDFYKSGIKYLGWSSWLEGSQIVKDGTPDGYKGMVNPRHGAIYSKEDTVAFCCDTAKKGGFIKFLYYKGKTFKSFPDVALTSNHSTAVALDSPRDGAKVKFNKKTTVCFDAKLNPVMIYQSGQDWI
jgi:hypothetical protein